MLLIVSGASGVGKSTLCNRLIAEFDDLRVSISFTTRAPRGREQEGVDYYFVAPATFDSMVAAGDFAEHAQVHGNSYGTSRAHVERDLNAGRSVLFDIDYQGARRLRDQYSDSVAVMILPPSMLVLEDRLRRRGTDTEETISRRLAAARMEMSHWRLFDYLVVNDDLNRGFDALRSIYVAERVRATRQAGALAGLVGHAGGGA